MKVLKMFLAGWILLLGAIIVNFAANMLGIATWHSFSIEIGMLGFVQAFAQTDIISKLFLFIIYPEVLGLSVFLICKYFKKK